MSYDSLIVIVVENSTLADSIFMVNTLDPYSSLLVYFQPTIINFWW